MVAGEKHEVNRDFLFLMGEIIACLHGNGKDLLEKKIDDELKKKRKITRTVSLSR